MFAVANLDFTQVGGSSPSIAGGVGLTKSGTGTVTFAQPLNHTGTTTVNQGTLTVGTTWGTDPALVIAPAGTLNFNTADTIASLTLYSGSTSGATFAGSAAATLAGNVALNVSGTGAAAATISAPLNLGGATRTFAVAEGTAAIDLSVSGVISVTGAFGITKTGAGTLALSGANTYTGTTTISQGTVSAIKVAVSSSNSSLGNATSAVVLGDASNTGTLSYTGNSASYTRGFTLNAGGGEVDVTTAGQLLTIATGGVTADGLLTVGGAGDTLISSVISSSGGLGKTGSGTLTLSGANTYAGSTTINAGTLAIDQGGSVNTSSGIWLGDTTGTAAASLSIVDADGGTTVSAPLTIRSGSSGTKTMQATNSSGINILSSALR